MTRFLLVPICLVSLSFASTAQASSIVLSDSATDSTVGVNQSLGLSDASSIYVWITPDTGQTINGVGLDVTSSDSAVLDGLSITIFNPTYSIIATPRWDSTVSGSLGDLVTDTNAVAVAAQGIDQNAVSLDGGVVDGSGAFLHAVIDFTATGVGTTTLTPQQSSSNFITGEGEGQIFPTFSGGTVSVIPEPGTLALIGLGGLCMLRRRSHA